MLGKIACHTRHFLNGTVKHDESAVAAGKAREEIKKRLPDVADRLVGPSHAGLAMELKDTLNLPKTNFPLRAELVQREPARRERWKKEDLYGKIQRARAVGPRFFLHDGPPFTNGDVHIGTAFNKILKDIIIRHRTMLGYRAPYVPGWDCHGLPIEHKVVKNLHAEGKDWDPVQLRRACAEFSQNYSVKQRGQFEQLGLLADWEREYRTMDPNYEFAVLEFFAKCVDRGLVYRSRKPVYWSIPCRTALAEAEIEYKDISSPSIWVKFPLDGPSRNRLGFSKPIFFAVWTTTPWSLPANLALALHPEFRYGALDCGDEIFFVASQLARSFAEQCDRTFQAVGEFSGRELIGLSARHPFLDRASPVCGADFVTGDAGSGCVHCAPGHGMEDYLMGLRSGLEPYCPVDGDGRYVDDGRMPKELVGLEILDGNGRCPAGEAVMELLKKNSNLLAEKTISHSYPHCWRSKTPVIYRAVDQWFLRLEESELRAQALAAVAAVRWVPDWGRNRIEGFLENRPDWCISRQRCWGIPLPVFFDSSGRPLLDGAVVRAVAEKLRRHGSDRWFDGGADWLLEGVSLPAGWDRSTLRPGTDTLDVWIDSGCSSCAVPAYDDRLEFPADLYVEGTDQHRGWFQSSLWCGLISAGRVPYRTVLTHGFIVGEDRKKISKSSDKPQSADGYVLRYGADVVRLWVASENFRGDVAISDGIMEHVAGAYGTIRNALRYLLGNLREFDSEKDALPLGRLLPLDRWALAKLGELIDEVSSAYDSFEFHRAYRALVNFCGGTLSALYHDMLKDRLYTYGRNWPERRSAQTAMGEILSALLALLLPILPFTADEAYAHLQCDGDFAENPAHLLPWPDSSRYDSCKEAGEAVDRILAFRAQAYRSLENARREKVIGKSLEAKVIFPIGAVGKDRDLLEEFIKFLPEIFIVSQVELAERDGEPLVAIVERADGERCSRCWRYCKNLERIGEAGSFCARCQKVLLEFFPKLV
ncbi:MAG: isoleucine--tRNA ligase [Puniceicoccales bacterium]|jgi:isoleucyl-tRNA synthetase|nr:isoleucine--tRNA ligase [Puniceicoccales bacterium]